MFGHILLQVVMALHYMVCYMVWGFLTATYLYKNNLIFVCNLFFIELVVFLLQSHTNPPPPHISFLIHSIVCLVLISSKLMRTLPDS